MIRLLTPADAPSYLRLRRAMLLESPWAFSSSPESDHRGDQARVAASFASPGIAAIGEIDGADLVSVGLLIREDGAKRSHLASICSVYTTPAARRRGLARAITTALIAAARSWPGVESLQLSVSDRSPEARALYESLGFRPWGTEPEAISHNGQSAAEIHMALRL